jgi:phosphotransferase system, enzyme I, PtsP
MRPSEKGFRYMPETGEELFSSFLGVPIQRVGEKLGVLVVQSKTARQFSEDDIYALDVVAMVLAEMTELAPSPATKAGCARCTSSRSCCAATSGQEGAAEGRVWLHEPRVVITNPVADDPLTEIDRIRAAVGELRVSIDDLLQRPGAGQGPEAGA